MDTKSPECFGTDTRTRGLRIELSAHHSLVLPYEQFMRSELRSEGERDVLRIIFMTHEIVLHGYALRRIESTILTRDLAWIAARPERYRTSGVERGYVTRIEVRQIQEPEPGAARSGD